MEFNKNDFKQGDLLIDLLVDNLVIDNESVRIDNIVGIKKQISNIDSMTKILEDSKKLNERIYTRKAEILLYLLRKAKELNYDLSSYDFPTPRHSYYALDLSNAENIIENELLSTNTNENKIEIIKDYYNGILEQQISSYSNIINRKLDKIIPPSEDQKKINEIIDEMHNNKVDIKDYNNINEYASKVQEVTEKDNKLFNQMLDVMDNEYQNLEKEYEQLPKVENVAQPEVKKPNVDVDKLISDIDKRLEELDKENSNDNNEFKLRFGNNVITDKEKYLEYSQIVEQEVFNNINDAKNKAIKNKLADMNNSISIFVKSGSNSPKYIIVSLKNREIAHNLFYEEAIDTSTLNILAEHYKTIKQDYNKWKDDVLARINSEEYQTIEEAKEKAKLTIKEDNDLTSVWEKDEKYYVVLSRDREQAFRNNYKELIKYNDLFEEMKQDRNDYFTYKQGDIQFGNSQCDFCKYNDLNNKSVCIKYPNGKPNNIINTEEKCEYLEMEESKI